MSQDPLSTLPQAILKSLKETKAGLSFEITNEANTRQETAEIAKKLRHQAYEKWKKYERKKQGEEGEELDSFPYWGIYGFDSKKLAHGRSIVKKQQYKDLELTEREQSGYLTPRIMACALSYLDVNPISKKLVLTRCHLSRKKLTNIKLLSHYHYLQHIDLSYNKLRDVSALDGIPYLIDLDLSHNFIDKVLDFKPPYYLTYVNLSNNRITELKDLSCFWALRTLDLSHNKIQKIWGLKKLKYLEILNLSYNNIRRIENLSYLNIVTLHLRRNHIQEFDCADMFGFHTNPNLTYVDLDHNELTSLRIFENAESVQSITIENNAIESLYEVTYLQNLNLLVYLNLTNNPVTKFQNYMLNILSICKKLNFLDTKPVHTKIKVDAESFFNPDFYEQTQIQFATVQVLNQLQRSPYVTIGALPCDLPPRPLLAIVGPPSSRGSRLASTLVQSAMQSVSLPKARLIVIHTTQLRKFKDGYFSTDRKVFTNMAKKGDFAIVYEIFQHMYGLTYQELEKTYDEPNKILIVRINLIGALLLRAKGYRPYLVLAVPSTAEIHRRWIAENFKIKPLHSIHRDSAFRLKLIKDKIEDRIMRPVEEEEFRQSGRTASVSDIEQELTNIYMNTPRDESLSRSEADVDEQAPYEHLNAQSNIKDVEESLLKKLNVKFGITKDEFVDPQTEKFSVSSSVKQKSISSDRSSVDRRSVRDSVEVMLMKKEKNLVKFDEQKNEIVNEESESDFRDGQNMGATCFCPVPISEKHFNDIVEMREIYIRFHQENPGIFCETVYTDFYEEAMKKLKKLLIKIAKNKQSDTPYHEFIEDDVYDKIIGEKIKMFQSQIDSAMKRNVPGVEEVEVCTGNTELSTIDLVQQMAQKHQQKKSKKISF